MSDDRSTKQVAAASVIIRAAVLLGAMAWGDLSIDRLAEARDGGSYLRFAAALRDADGFASLASYDRRVFPGYPAVLSATGLYAIPLVAMIVNWAIAAGVAVLSYRLFEDARVGWAMAVLTPSYVMYSTVIMTEPLMLLLALGALHAGRRDRPLPAGAFLGFAAMVRPFALPIGLAYLAEHRQRPRRIVMASVVATLVIAVCVAAFALWSGSIASGVRVYATEPRAYGGARMFDWPFASLLRLSFGAGVATWKIAYVWLHVAAAFGALVLLLRKTERSLPLVVWHASNLLIVLCVGGVWGFHEFHRLLVPSLPPIMWAYRRLLPQSTIAWVAIAIVSAALAVIGLGHGW